MSSNINPETGEYIVNEGRSPRFVKWVFLLMCSCVTLSASIQVRNDMEKPNEASKWAVGGSALTLIVAFFISIFHLNAITATMVVGSIFEGISSFIMLVVWAATVSIVTKTGNDLGVVKSDTNQVGNGNLYYFSWGGFVLSMVLFFSYLRSARGLDVADAFRGRGQRMGLWAGYFAASIVILGSAGRVLNEDCKAGDETHSTDYCKRAKLAMGIGALGFIFSFVIVALKLFSSVSYHISEGWLACLATAVNAMGVAFITSNKGPGRAIGNLYYFSWIACIVAGAIAVDCFNANKAEVAQSPNQSSKPDDQMVADPMEETYP